MLPKGPGVSSAEKDDSDDTRPTRPHLSLTRYVEEDVTAMNMSFRPRLHIVQAYT